jgi:hypothetical protein
MKGGQRRGDRHRTLRRELCSAHGFLDWRWQYCPIGHFHRYASRNWGQGAPPSILNADKIELLNFIAAAMDRSLLPVTKPLAIPMCRFENLDVVDDTGI